MNKTIHYVGLGVHKNSLAVDNGGLQPPTTRRVWKASTHGQAGGLPAISRWLSEERATPPVLNPKLYFNPNGIASLSPGLKRVRFWSAFLPWVRIRFIPTLKVVASSGSRRDVQNRSD